MERVHPLQPEEGRVLHETATYEAAAGPESGLSTSEPWALARGNTVRRYIILDRVGEGGMGVVYAAYDPSLDRRVALKFLRPREAGEGGVREKRLLREAQAMARLSHPNVAVAYEVGTFKDHVFLAMEFVDGVDLHTWLAEKPRSCTEILEVFQAAGRGLAAAHAASIIHRDFKPENVLVDRRGRPRVTDFGLSRASHDPAEEVAEPSADPGGSACASPLSLPLALPSHLSTPLTGTGGVLGTPSYMAPEQHVGGAVDGRSDQFSFCVALYEALYREHPFPGSGAERVGNVLAGRVAPAPAQSTVPRWCRQALLRGLAAAPEDRFPSMYALLAALTPHPKSRRRQVALAGLIGFLVAGAGAYTLGLERSAEKPRPRCDLGAQRVSGVWDGVRKNLVRDAFKRSGARGADVTWKSFSAIVDERAGAWVAMHNQACAATHIDGLQSAAVLDLRMECLERKRQEMKDLVDVYSAGVEATSLDRAVTAADRLSSVAACADVANLRAVVPLPDDPGVRANVQSIRQRLSYSRALYEAGRYEQGREYMESLKQEADAVGYAPLAAEAGHALAIHLSLAGKNKEAEQILFDAGKQAVEARDWNGEAEIWLELLANYERVGRVKEGLLAARVAELAVGRAKGDELLTARLANHIAYAKGAAGSLEEMLRDYRRAEKLWKKSLGVTSPRYADALHKIGGTLVDLGRIHEGMNYLERALDLRRAILRPDHPDIAESLYLLGVAYLCLGLFEKGREIVQRSFEIRVRQLGPEHAMTTRTLQARADAEACLGNFDRALKMLASLLATRKRVLDPQGILLFSTYAAIGEAQRLAGLGDEAERTYKQLIEYEARAGFPKYLGTGYALTFLGKIHNGRRLHRQALSECRRGLDILSRFLGPDSSRLIDTRECIGEALMAAGDVDDARKQLERAVLSVAGGDLGPQWTAGARFQLARALWATPADRPRARELAKITLNELAGAEGDNRKMMARIEIWLRSVGNARVTNAGVRVPGGEHGRSTPPPY